VPLDDGLPWLGDHVLPMLGLGRPGSVFTSQKDAPDELISTDIVEVHDHDVQRTFSDLLPGNVEAEVLVEHWVQSTLEYGGLTFLNTLVSELEPYLYVGVRFSIDVFCLEVACLEKCQGENAVARVVAEGGKQFPALVLGGRFQRFPERRFLRQIHLA